ncbi:MAG TPA: class I SAM-dependent methyltransferase [Acidimicrobiales bacterium]|nr:class I SAM-dependent methyltransferase [Acidimicrobiales bacterium]
MPNLQEVVFSKNVDYRVGSPHLAHAGLNDRLVQLLSQVVRDLKQREMPLTVLEIGAGHGGYTEPALAFGCSVTATEMSRSSAEALRDRFSTNEHFAVVFDPDGSLDVVGTQRFSLVLCSSVLHHIPDYLSFIEHSCSRHLAVGGSFLSIQDPLWYPDLGRPTRTLSRAAFLSWRVTQGHYKRGILTLSRRVRGVYDDDQPSDSVEYHVVRQGVNQHAVMEYLQGAFEDARLTRYWSTQARAWQYAGEIAKLENTFAVEGRRFRSPTVPAG